MKTLLTVISVNDGNVLRSSLELLSRCTEIAGKSGDLSAALIIDENAGSYVDTVKAYGPAKIYLVDGALYRNHLNAPMVHALSAAMDEIKPKIVVFASTEGSKDILGALAARQNSPALADMSEFEILENGVRGKRPVMAAKILTVVEAEGDPVIISVRSGSYDLSESPGEPEIVKIDTPSGDGLRSAVLKEIIEASGKQRNLSESDIIIAAGRGVRDEKGVQLISELASVLNAGVGASRALTESGVYDPSLQIGQTGKVVSPSLYIAVGISGAIQHVAGITNSKFIVAVNKDPEAPIFDIADYGMVGDLYEVLPPFIDELKKIKGR